MSEVTLTDSSGVERFRGTQDGGGSLTVTDGSTTVDPATTLNFGGATVGDGGGGLADITVVAPPSNLADVLAEGSNGGGTGMTNTGSIDTGGDGINTGSGALDTGGGNISSGAGNITTTTGNVVTGTGGAVKTDLLQARAPGVGVGGLTVGGSGDFLGFYGTSPLDRPEIPAVPTPQNIVDALVALGLVTQAS